MKIFFKRTGGLAAISLSVTLDTDALPAEDSRRLQNLINAVSFFNQPDSLRSAKPGADLFHYEIKAEVEGRIKTIEIDESVVPDIFRPLLDHLIELARVKKK
ncbi:MAG: hypothetical protein A2Z47_01015 [Thermodesulfovibrio sp. RBG_19FT_COMBO_42_12]|nr:MAG: hypothetical protein A2Z47_01015 [Thermodesulfovibrio sp. RBG_19FT_COMBO_42_12]